MSNSALQVFNFDSHQVRVVSDGLEQPLFVALDVARALGYEKPKNAISRFCRGAPKQGLIEDRLGRNQKTKLIYEPDVYRLIFGSKLKSAQKFQDWVFEEVLPSIRKTGGFQLNTPTEKEQLLLTDGRKAISKAVKQIVAIKKKRKNPVTHQEMWQLVHAKTKMPSIEEATPEQISTALEYVADVLEGELLAPEVEHVTAVQGMSPEQESEVMGRLQRLGRLFHPLSEQASDVSGIIKALQGRHPRLGHAEPNYNIVININ